MKLNPEEQQMYTAQLKIAADPNRVDSNSNSPKGNVKGEADKQVGESRLKYMAYPYNPENESVFGKNINGDQIMKSNFESGGSKNEID